MRWWKKLTALVVKPVYFGSEWASRLISVPVPGFCLDGNDCSRRCFFSNMGDTSLKSDTFADLRCFGTVQVMIALVLGPKVVTSAER